MHPETAAKHTLPEHNKNSEVSSDSYDLEIPEVINPPTYIDGSAALGVGLFAVEDLSQLLSCILK